MLIVNMRNETYLPDTCTRTRFVQFVVGKATFSLLMGIDIDYLICDRS